MRHCHSLLIPVVLIGLLANSATPAITYTVNSAADTGAGTLREAIGLANGHSGSDVIQFAIGSGAATITLDSALPDITDSVTIDGWSQPGWSNTPLIRIDGAKLPGGYACLRIYSASATIMRGLIFTHCPGSGLALGGGSGHQIYGNYFGTDGSQALGNGSGLDIYASSSNNKIGGPNLSERNVFSGNNVGLSIASGSSGNTVVNAYAGTNAAGSAAIPNTYTGINVDGNNNTIGGSTSNGDANVVSGNGQAGITLGSGSTGNAVLSNRIGTNANGTAALGNGGFGLVVNGSSATIGQGGGNLISGNQADGILIGDTASDVTLVLNLIGTDSSGKVALPNHGGGINIYGNDIKIGANVISGNQYSGIDIKASARAVVMLLNYIGTDVSGKAALGNLSFGVAIHGDAILGASGAGNLISGNQADGVLIDNTTGSVTLQANQIGIDGSGALALPNHGSGINIYGANVNVTGNIVSGNQYSGVDIKAGASSVTLLSNRIGTNASGTAAVGNQGSGVAVHGSATLGASGAGNLISGNQADGVLIDNTAGSVTLIANQIGTDTSGTLALPNHGSGIHVYGKNVALGSAGIGNLVSANQYDGITISSPASQVTVVSNRVGTTADGLAALGNGGYALNLVGGSGISIGTAGAGNVFSGNGRGVNLASGGVSFKGNIVGLTADQSTKLMNPGSGLDISSANNQIGGAAAGEGNVIAGFGAAGISLSTGAASNHIEGNFIGTNASLATGLGNGSAGVFISQGHDNVIGGTTVGTGNVITGSYLHGVYHALGYSNAVLGNRIYGSGRSDIEIDPLGPEANDTLDTDGGPNGHQNTPTITSAQLSGTTLTIAGTLRSAANGTYRIEYFHSQQCHPSGVGGGETFLGATTVTTDANGTAALNTPVSNGPAVGVIAATATDAAGNTSEFSPCTAIGTPGPGVFGFSRSGMMAYEDVGALTVAIIRSMGSTGSATVTLVTQDGTATAPSDYAAQNLTVTFAPGETVKLVTIPLVLDNVAEGTESFGLVLQNPTGGTILGTQANVSVSLADHDPAYPFVAVGDVTLSEPANGQALATFHVTLSGSNHPVSFNYSTFDGTAKAGSDYVAASGTLDFAVGETDKTVSVPVLADQVLEGDESFFLNVTANGSQQFIAYRLTGEATIHNNGGSDTIFRDGFGP